MKFYGEPNLLVNTKVKINGTFKLKPLFKFNNKGEYETDDIKLIEKLKQHFKFENNVKNELICKHCGESFENKGLLLAHYRKEHPKER